MEKIISKALLTSILAGLLAVFLPAFAAAKEAPIHSAPKVSIKLIKIKAPDLPQIITSNPSCESGHSVTSSSSTELQDATGIFIKKSSSCFIISKGKAKYTEVTLRVIEVTESKIKIAYNVPRLREPSATKVIGQSTATSLIPKPIESYTQYSSDTQSLTSFFTNKNEKEIKIKIIPSLSHLGVYRC